MSRFWQLISRLQDRAARVIGVSPEDRVAVLDGMLRRVPSDAIGYWLQLLLSMAIATLGLAMGSTAVVIGAMLISPLMQPLLELGMGLATGSLLLSIRAGVRTTFSIVVVVLGAAGVTRLLPFHEITAELAARTSPTVLDLFIAMACALAAAYTTVRQGKDAISAAAGTAIGIALVPPLCTAGYGLGTTSVEVLRGALLLFTANFAAIIAVTAVTVVILGFGQVDANAIEDEVLAGTTGGRLSYRAARLSRRAVGRPLGVLTRLLVPAAMVGAIAVPLRRALVEVSWQVRVRAEIEELLAGLDEPVMRQSLDVRGGTVRLRVLLIGDEAEAREVADLLRGRIAQFGGSEPLVEVIAVADAATLDEMSQRLLAARPAPPPPAPLLAPVAGTYAVELTETLAAAWPASAGELLRIRTTTPSGSATALVLETTHLGSPLADAGRELLARALSAALRVEVTVRERVLPTAPVVAPAAEGAAWLPRAIKILEHADGVEGLRVCIEAPAPPPPARRPAAMPDERQLVARLLTAVVADRADVSVRPGPAWSLETRRGDCPPAP